jgi:hypothetical protein
MTVTYVRYGPRRLRVSREWAIVLTAADRAGVAFTLNSGHRTFAEQAELRRRYLAGTGNLAAVPSHAAPHIRTGRPDHAIDVDALDGGETRLQRWLERQGARPTNPVRGEAWHVELPLADLRRLASRLALPPLKPDEKRAAAELLRRRRSARRHHGWKRLHPSHLAGATKAKRAIGKRIRELRAVKRPTAGQTARLRYLRAVYHGRLT